MTVSYFYSLSPAAGIRLGAISAQKKTYKTVAYLHSGQLS